MTLKIIFWSRCKPILFDKKIYSLYFLSRKERDKYVVIGGGRLCCPRLRRSSSSFRINKNISKCRKAFGDVWRRRRDSCPLAVPKIDGRSYSSLSILTAAPTNAPCIRHRRRSRVLPAPSALEFEFPYKQKHIQMPKGILRCLAQKERLELSRRFPDLRP